MYGYLNKDELYHYGVMGMKWGVRKDPERKSFSERHHINTKPKFKGSVKKSRSNLAGVRIRNINVTRQQNKNTIDAMNKNLELKYGKNSKLTKRKKAWNDAVYKRSEVTNKYAIARQQAKKDKSYKNTSEYKSARRDFGRAVLKDAVLGEYGAMRAEQFKNMGKKHPNGKAAAEQFLIGAGTIGVMVGTTYLMNKRYS